MNLHVSSQFPGNMSWSYFENLDSKFRNFTFKLLDMFSCLLWSFLWTTVGVTDQEFGAGNAGTLNEEPRDR